MLKAIPHTTMQITFVGAAFQALLPTFRGSVLGELKRVRHFYLNSGLDEFYTPDKDMSALVDRDLDDYLVYGNVMSLEELPDDFDYPGFTGAQQDFFTLDQDSVKLAGANVKWKGAALGDTDVVFPYYTGSGITRDFVIGKKKTSATPSAWEVTVPQTFFFKITKDDVVSIGHVFLADMTVDAVYDLTDVANAALIRWIKESTAMPAAVSVFNIQRDADYNVTAAFTGAGYTIEFFTVDELAADPFPSDPTIGDGMWLYMVNAAGAVTAPLYEVLRGIQGYGDVAAGIPVTPVLNEYDTHLFVNVAYTSGYDNVFNFVTSNITSDSLFTAFDVDNDNKVFTAFYSYLYTESSGVVVTTPVPGDTLLQAEALNTFDTVKNSLEDLLFCCDAHVEYVADFASSVLDNTYMNRVYRSNAAVSVWPVSDGAYKWGLPHPDNPMGFAASIVRTILGLEDNYFFVVLGDNKAKAFDLAAAEIPRVLFISNVWEEYGEGGLSEGTFLDVLATQRGDYPGVFTWTYMNPRVDKRGTEDAVNAYKGSVTLGDYYLNKHANDINFTADPAVAPGDIVELLYTDATTQRMVVTGVEASRVRLSRKVTKTDTPSPSFTIYKKMTSAEAKTFYNSKFASSTFNLFNTLNQSIQWGTHYLSNKWMAPLIMAMKLVYPEQQPLTGITVDIGNFGVAYGGTDFFDMDDLDALVVNGYYVFVSDPGAATCYSIRDVTAGLKSDDYRRGNGNAVIPIITFSASCRAVLDQLKGKYNKNQYLRQLVKLGLEAVETKYTKTPPVPDFGSKLVIARFKSMTAITGGYQVTMEIQPQEQANIFDLRINVIQEVEG